MEQEIKNSTEHIEPVEAKTEPEIDYKAEYEKAQLSLKEKEEQYKQLEQAKEKEILTFLNKEQLKYPLDAMKSLADAFIADRKSEKKENKKSFKKRFKEWLDE